MAYLEVDNARFHYLEAGEGPLALFIHGFPLDARMWFDQVEQLADQRRCVAVDLRGSGRSSSFVGEALTMDRHAADMAALIKGLGEKNADVVALSMGGYVALALLEAQPERFRSVALIDTKATADDEAGRAARDGAKERLLAEGRPAFAAGMLGMLVAATTGPTVRARVTDMIEDTPYETIAATLEGMKQRPDRSGLLGRIGFPALVVVGEEDALMPPDVARVMAAAIPEARFDVVPGAGHLTPMEQPQAFNAILREFWGALPHPGQG